MYQVMPRNGGTTLRFRRYNPLNTAMVPLGNSGVTPPPQNLTAVDIDAKISFYGTYVTINEQVTLQNQDPVLNEGSRRLGVSLRQTEDQLTRDMLQSTASFINCVGGVNGDSPTEITRSDVDTVVQALMGNNAYTITDLIQGEDRFGSSPVRNAYLALCHTDLVSNLNNVAGFTNVAQYPNNNNVPDCEYGAISNLRFQVSSIGAVAPNASSLGKNVYSIFCTGREAYANVKQEGYADSFIYRSPIYSDPLAQNASIGWKTAMVPRLLNDLWLINLRCTLA